MVNALISDGGKRAFIRTYGRKPINELIWAIRLTGKAGNSSSEI